MRALREIDSVRSRYFRVRFVLVGIFCFVPVAHAYVDPGSGLLLIQGLLAFIGGVVVFLKHPVQTFKQLIRRLRRHEDA